MLDSKSIKTRFLVSLVSNTTRALASFLSGLLVARGLNPSGYGDLTFLLGSFVAIRSIFDMGSASAFYTFLSQKQQKLKFYLFYFGWLGFQFLLTSLLVTVIMPQSVIDNIWLGHSRGLILLAFIAAFMQQQIWLMIGQIGESKRKTGRVQIMNVGVAVTHLSIVTFLLMADLISVKIILTIMIFEYIAGTSIAYVLLHDKKENQNEPIATEFSFKQIFKDYWKYCKPLLILSIVHFLYDFTDKWMLQKFGGASQQGYYQIAYQFAAISLIATTSIINIFWKEIAEAEANGEKSKVAYLYRRVTRGLFMFGAVLSGFLIPWTEQIVLLLLKKTYIMAAPVLAIIFVFPVFRSLGQVSSAMFLASGQTRTYMVISVIITAISLPITYLTQASPSAPYIPGLGLGAVGMAIKVVILSIISVNLQTWVIARRRNWKFDWLFQVIGIGSVIGTGYLAYFIVGSLYDLSKTGILLLPPFIIAGLIYLTIIACLIWWQPWLAGITRDEIRQSGVKLKDFYRTHLMRNSN